MRILVVGAGALGILFAGVMSRHGGDVTILTRRREAAEAISSNGVIINEGKSSWRAWPNCTTDPRTASSTDLCLICVKSYDTETVARMVSPYLNERCIIATVQNGLNNVERLAEAFGPERVVAGYTLQASTLTGLNSVYHAYDGETVLGRHPSTTTPVEKIGRVADELTRMGLKTSAVENVYPEVLTKLIINSVINPLTALLGVRNGELLEVQELSWVIDRLVEEGVEACYLLGAKLSPGQVKSRVYEAIKATYENKSSMLQDIERGRRTEIEFINGALARILRAAGRPAPTNTLLTQLVLAAERKGRRS
ncbi:2-dehydropantoate 2-reductase [Candidatus Calditenuaceae archaeon HR02]|nr:2-dehydropantoate 2-reductase [Candidatus Calditenuaceae archaeon HR02]